MTTDTKTQSTPKPPREDDKYDVWRRDYIEPFYAEFERKLRADSIKTSDLPDNLLRALANGGRTFDGFVAVFLNYGNDYLQRMVIPIEVNDMEEISSLLSLIAKAEQHRRTQSLPTDTLFESFLLLAFNYRLHPYLKKMLPFSWVIRTLFNATGFGFLLSNDYVDPDVAYREFILSLEAKAREIKMEDSTTEASPEPQAQGV